MDPQGKVAVVSGGNSGLGAAAARHLAAGGATVVCLDIAGEARAEVSVVKVADPMNFMMVYQLPGADGGLPLGVQKKLDELEKGERAVLQKARDIGTRRGVAVKTKLLAGGNFADSLIREAEESQADMIVAGTLGHSRLGGLLLGSVTRNLISLAPMPVLVVKQ